LGILSVGGVVEGGWAEGNTNAHRNAFTKSTAAATANSVFPLPRRFCRRRIIFILVFYNII